MAFYIEKHCGRIKRSYLIEVVTPLFISGADTQISELRASSLKGLLRFWWRAINPINDLNNSQNKEGKIFGSTMNDSSCKSSFSLMIEPKEVKIEQNMPKGKMVAVNSSKKQFNIDIFTYLGIGIYDPKTRQWARKNIAPGSTFIIHCTYDSESIKDEIEKALSALIHYGGLGAKSRNGFGSLFSKDVPYINFLDKNKNVNVLPYTTFSSKSKIFLFNEQKNWIDALSDIGIAYRQMRLSTEMDRKHDYRNRKYIGLPIVQANNEEVKKGRHAKPCFLHVSKNEKGYKGQILILPYNYSKPLNNRNNEYDNTIKKMIYIFEKIQKNEKMTTIY